MTASGGPVASLLGRLDAVERRLAQRAGPVAPAGLTEPDAATGERWEAGQVWAHIAEFVPYWTQQARRIVASGGAEPVPFGRTKGDAGRLAAIERDRRESPAALMARVRAALADLRAWLHTLPTEAWSARGRHPARGEMDLAQALDHFVVAHLEEHAEQLERLGP